MASSVFGRWSFRVLVLAVAFGCGFAIASARRGCEQTIGPKAKIIRIRGESALIVFQPSFFRELFGARWEYQSVFYGFNRMIDQDGRPAGKSAAPSEPLAKGETIVMTSGDDWENLVCTLFVLETRTLVSLKVNLQTGTVDLLGSPAKWNREVVVNDLGRLVFL